MRALVVGFLALAAACGDGGGAAPGACGFASDRYLPFEVGNQWTYQVTDLGSGQRSNKDQRLDEELDDAGFGPVIVQTTIKNKGSTRSLFSLDGDRVVRRSQEDLDGGGALERTTTYQPGQIRIDESVDRLVTGTEWDESYDEVVRDAAGGPPATTATTDHWLVVDADVPCDAPLGSFRCLRLRRTRTAGGVAEKEFFFARGIGKVREAGDSQLEELAGCSVAAP